MAIAEMAGRCAADNNIVVVSGGALGCDYTAGTSALNADENRCSSRLWLDVTHPTTSCWIFWEQYEKEGERLYL